MAAPKSGLNALIGFAEESTWGVPVAPTRFADLVSETMGQDKPRVESKAQRQGRRVLDTNQWSSGVVKADGGVQLEMCDRGQGLLWKHMMGGTAITGSGPYTQTYTPGDLGGLGLTVQVGVPDLAGNVEPKTYPGSKVAKWNAKFTAGEIATLGLDFMSKWEIRSRVVTDGVTTSASASITSATAVFVADDIGKPISGTGIPAGATIATVTSATAATLSANATASGTGVTFTIGVALATASYPSGQLPFHVVNCAVSAFGSSIDVKEVSLSGDNKLERDPMVGKYYVGEGIESALREYTGEMTPEFTSKTMYERFVNGGTGSLVILCASGASGSLNTATFTCNIRLDGETPKVASTKVVDQPIKFKMLGSTDAAAIQLVTINSDAAA